MDNGPFAALLLAAATRAYGPTNADAARLFCELEPAARRGLDFVNRSKSSGLVYNSELSPNCTYGFTDGIVKTGEVLFTSLLYIDASRQMAALSRTKGCGDSARYLGEAAQLSASIDRMRSQANSSAPLWQAATIDGALPDIWGTAYLVSLGLSTPERRHAAMEEMVARPERYFEEGSVRSIPVPLVWAKCFYKCWGAGAYQNGGFWSTALTYVVPALIATGHRLFAQTLLSDAVGVMADFGIYEWQNLNSTRHLVPDSCYCKLPCASCDGKLPCKPCDGAWGVYNYTATVVNVLGVATQFQLSA
eukprot:SAG22_NODE_1675_length_3830_cov_4.460198_3_plen_305_part_00